jgi:hypothetical protein
MTYLRAIPSLMHSGKTRSSEMANSATLSLGIFGSKDRARDVLRQMQLNVSLVGAE